MSLNQAPLPTPHFIAGNGIKGSLGHHSSGEGIAFCDDHSFGVLLLPLLLPLCLPALGFICHVSPAKLDFSFSVSLPSSSRCNLTCSYPPVLPIFAILTELQDTVGESAGWGLGELTLGAGLLKEARGTNLDL